MTRNFPRPNCLLECLLNCLSPAREGFVPSSKFVNFPDLPFLAFCWDFLAFFCFSMNSLLFFEFFPFLRKDFRGSPGKKNPCFFSVVFLAFYGKSRERKITVTTFGDFSHFRPLSQALRFAKLVTVCAWLRKQNRRKGKW